MSSMNEARPDAQGSAGTHVLTDMHQTIVSRVWARPDTLDLDGEHARKYQTYGEYRRDEWVKQRIRLVVGKLGIYPQMTVAYPAEPANYPRLPLEQIVSAIRELPDLRLAKRVLVTDLVDADEAWARAHSKGDAGSGLVYPTRASIDSELLIYRPQDVRALIPDLQREWLYLLFCSSRRAAFAFAAVGDFELLSDGKDYSSNPHVAWVHLGQRLFLEDARVPISSADVFPIRFTILARSVKDQMRTVPAELRCRKHNEIVVLCDYIQRRVTEKVTGQLKDCLEGATPEQTTRVNFILAYLQ